jgi:ketosteroid isomerase-like protein
MTFSVPTRRDYNRRMRKSVMVLMAVVSLAAACGGTKPGAEFPMKDQAAIRERNDAFVKAFNQKDVAQVLTVYAENSVFMPPNQPIIRGRDALKTFYDELLASGATGLRLNASEISGHGPLAYQSGTYEMDVKSAKGTAAHDRGKYLFVMRRMADTWRFEYSMWNSDLAASAP